MYILEPEYLVVEDITICGTNRRRVPYAECSVDKSTACGCCTSVNDVSPGCGCNGILVDEIAHELQIRVGARGMTAQLQQSEQMAIEIHQVLMKIDALDKKVDMLVQRMQR
jgi:hypothetical protein